MGEGSVVCATSENGLWNLNEGFSEDCAALYTSDSLYLHLLISNRWLVNFSPNCTSNLLLLVTITSLFCRTFLALSIGQRFFRKNIDVNCILIDWLIFESGQISLIRLNLT